MMWPLFWCLESNCQAKLMQWQWDNYGQKIEIPAPPRTSKAAWQAVQVENSDEIDRLIRKPPRHQKRVA